MNCATYARVSTSEQIKGYSIEAQQEACRQYADNHRWDVVREYVDAGLSGTNDQRPEFQRMIREALSGQFGAIVVYSFDRFSRNIENTVVYKGLLRRDGIQIVSVTEPVDDSPMGFIHEGIIDLFSAYYSLNLSVKIRDGLAKAVKNGRWPWPTPLGYKKVDGWVLVTEAGAGIRQAFEEFATGRYTLETWADTAYRLGLRSQNGKKINIAGWSRIFHNQFYLGRVIWNDLNIEGQHEPLIDKETFNQVQEILESREGGGVQYVYRSYLLRGMCWSLDANCPMTGAVAKGKFLYYRSRNPGPDGKRHHVPAKKLENQVAFVLTSISAPKADLANLDIDDSMRLALQVAQNVGAIYQLLKTNEQRRTLLDLVVDKYGLKVCQDQIVDVETRHPFCFQLDKILVEMARVELASRKAGYKRLRA